MKDSKIILLNQEFTPVPLIPPHNKEYMQNLADRMADNHKRIAKEISDKVEKVLKSCLLKTGNDLSEETAKRVTQVNCEDKPNYSEYFLDKGTDKEILLMTHQINFETKDGIPSVSQEFGAIVEVEK